MPCLIALPLRRLRCFAFIRYFAAITMLRHYAMLVSNGFRRCFAIFAIFAMIAVDIYIAAFSPDYD